MSFEKELVREALLDPIIKAHRLVMEAQASLMYAKSRALESFYMCDRIGLHDYEPYIETQKELIGDWEHISYRLQKISRGLEEYKDYLQHCGLPMSPSYEFENKTYEIGMTAADAVKQGENM